MPEKSPAEKIKLLEKMLDEIANSSIGFKEKLDRISKHYMTEMQPFIVSGDDGTISRMRNAAGAAVEKTVEIEIRACIRTKDAERLEEARRAVTQIHWIAEGFKSSVNVEIAFAKVKIGGTKDF